jgi:hypothetical protein
VRRTGHRTKAGRTLDAAPFSPLVFVTPQAGAMDGAFANPASPARAPYTLQRKNGRFPPLLCFQDVNAHSPRGCRTITRSREFFFLAACFLQVYARKRGNRPFFALLPPSSLIPCTLTYVSRKLLCSSRLGVTCHPSSRRRRPARRPGSLLSCLQSKIFAA